MRRDFNLQEILNDDNPRSRYEKQLERLRMSDKSTGAIEDTVKETFENLTSGVNSLVIYGEPQSGKTEMMICLTAHLLDEENELLIHLLNDSVDLLSQSLSRFSSSGLAPSPKNSTEIVDLNPTYPGPLIIFCKKNVGDLKRLNEWIAKRNPDRLVVIDDEADYATPNSKINQGLQTAINEQIGILLSSQGTYIGVTATPARLDLNKTFDNNAERWVNFAPHSNYTGQDVFFPIQPSNLDFRLKLLGQNVTQSDLAAAFIRFLVTSSYMCLHVDPCEENYSMLIHTSGRMEDHGMDRNFVRGLVETLSNRESVQFPILTKQIFESSGDLFPDRDPNPITRFIIDNATRIELVLLNSERDRRTAGENPALPRSPFTVIFGGNIVSRGVTFPNLLSMFFTRTVAQRLQQDTYIQRARMFGDRGRFLQQFELTIPISLYTDWHTCFMFHRLALDSIKSNLGSPVWLSNNRVSVAAPASINRATVSFDRGEMAFGQFDFSERLDLITAHNPMSIVTLEGLNKELGNECLPKYLIEFIRVSSASLPGRLAIHQSFNISNYGDADQDSISRRKGFIGTNQLEKVRFPNAVHHIKIFRNRANRARIYYKMIGNIQFIRNEN